MCSGNHDAENQPNHMLPPFTQFRLSSFGVTVLQNGFRCEINFTMKSQIAGPRRVNPTTWFYTCSWFISMCILKLVNRTDAVLMVSCLDSLVVSAMIKDKDLMLLKIQVNHLFPCILFFYSLSLSIYTHIYIPKVVVSDEQMKHNVVFLATLSLSLFNYVCILVSFLLFLFIVVYVFFFHFSFVFS